MPDTLTIQLEGSLDDNGHVRLDEFLEELEAIKNALKHTQRIVNVKPHEMYYRIVDLSHKSPATMRIEGVPRSNQHRSAPRRVFRKFTTSLRMIGQRHRAPQDFDLETLQAYQNITNPLRKNLRKIVIVDDQQKKAQVNQEYEDAIRRIIGPDQLERGSLAGRLEALNVHKGNNTFNIYPTIGPSKVTCRFMSDLRDTVLRYAGHYVLATGWLHFKADGKFPHAIDVKKLESFTEDNVFSTLSDIHGIAPNATDGVPSEEFIRKIRDGEW